MKKELKEYFSKIGTAGGKKSRRNLSRLQALKMINAREQKKFLKGIKQNAT